MKDRIKIRKRRKNVRDLGVVLPHHHRRRLHQVAVVVHHHRQPILHKDQRVKFRGLIHLEVRKKEVEVEIEIEIEIVTKVELRNSILINFKFENYG